MYKCLKCGNTKDFEEINVVRTSIRFNDDGDIKCTNDKFIRKEEVYCSQCRRTMTDRDVVEI